MKLGSTLTYLIAVAAAGLALAVSAAPPETRPTTTQTSQPASTTRTGMTETSLGKFDGKPITKFAASPDGTRVAFFAQDKAKRHWQLFIDGKLQTQPQETYSHPLEVVFSPDGKHVAWLAMDGDTKLAVLNGKVLARGKHLFNTLYFSGDSQHLAVLAKDGQQYQVILDGKVVASHEDQIDDSLIINHDGSKFLTVLRKPATPATDPNKVEAGTEARACLALNGKPAGEWFFAVRIFGGPFGPGRSAFSPDGKHFLAIAERSGSQILLLDGKEHATCQRFINVGFSPDGKVFYSTQNKRPVRASVVVDSKSIGEHVTRPVFSGDGKHWAFALVDRQQEENVWTLWRDGKEVGVVEGAPVALNRDGTILASVCTTGVIRATGTGLTQWLTAATYKSDEFAFVDEHSVAISDDGSGVAFVAGGKPGGHTRPLYIVHNKTRYQQPDDATANVTDPKDGTPRVTNYAIRDESFTLSRDGKHLAWLVWQDRQWVLRLDDEIIGRYEWITTLPDGKIARDDKDRLIYTARRGDEIVRVVCPMSPGR